MTHLSDFSYLLIMQTVWDMTSTWIKYSESFIQVPQTDTFVSKPFVYWTSNHQQVAMAIDYVECVTLSLQTGIFFLLQCFWNYLSNTVAKKSFMSSWEFRFYIFWALGSMAIFPILQWYYRDDVNKREAVPQLAYSIETFFAALLGIRSHFRFRRIIQMTRNKGSVAITGKIGYFKDMNLFMTSVLFLMSISLGILCVDGLTSGQIINSNKFATDLLTGNFDTCIIFLWIIGISIFHPRRSTDEISASGFSKSLTDVENKSAEKNQRVAQFVDNGPSFLRPMSPVQVDYPPNVFPKQYNIPSHEFQRSQEFHRPQEFPMQTMNSHDFEYEKDLEDSTWPKQFH
ncbi:hypothetical protein CU098_008838 [Rhizopus stolonifer]|uniref:Uncharacterized protein n=1 Tax=Rhizopus stolonifer TaxID=4846 RepID=A0A367KKU5_RHIST|nr:hypothetical protein CU098_008838 [Rhizopus stolonifer]